ncbi:MAG: 50S ribosomal protein L9, partial [Deltaproteobacteria bacterium]|nr:50S ribosomal protein L9 [Deltaproteobacteria bacterium]
DRLQSIALEVTARVGEEGKLFGSVTSAHIAELLAEKGYKIDRRKIQLGEPLREIGDHVVPIRLQTDITAEVALKISAES